MDNNTFEDLNIPNLLLNICPDENIVKNVTTRLQALQQNQDNIIQKQREINDIISNPELLSILQRQTRQLEDLREQHKKERLSVAKSRAQSTHITTKEQLAPIISNILIIVKHAEECIKLYSDIPVYLRDFALTSDFLKGFKESLVKIIDGDVQKRLKAFFKDIKNLQGASSWHQTRISIAYTMNDSFDKLTYRISQLLFELTPASVGRNFIFQRKESLLRILRRNESRRREEEFEIAESFFTHSVMGGLMHLMDILTQFTDRLQKPFEHIHANIPLYKFGTVLAARYKTQGVDFCFPEILPPGSSSVNPLILRYGGDGVDHFSFLQEYAMLQLFAQAGLPVAAEHKQVAIVSDLFAQFSSNELVLGRFEEEVREMALLCRRVKPHGLVLFHEVFQSTAYEEIAKPFAEIVKYLIELPCTVVLVTHNSFLVEQLQDGG